MVNKFSSVTGIRRDLITQIKKADWNSLLNYYGRGESPSIDPNPPYPGEPMPDELYEKMLEEAEKYIGREYVWGGKTPPNFDCSGYVGWCYKFAGIMPESVVSYTLTIREWCNLVPEGEERAGDIPFWWAGNESSSHCAIYVGNDTILDCAGGGIDYRPLSWHSSAAEFMGFYRPPNM